MSRIVDIHDFLEGAEESIMVDVRSPSEFRQGHIPGAINIPLFSDEERKTVGILYKNSGRSAAIQEGFRILAARYSSVQESISEFPKERETFMYCWRGGMRSGAMGWLSEKLGHPCVLLKGGYKSYRRLARKVFSSELKLNILGGMTGSGKTHVLHELKKRGHQVVDLEGIACHKGSAFGALGENPQPSTEHFENLLLAKFLKLDPEKPVWLEDESQSIGKVFIPPELFSKMRSSPIFIVEIPLEERLKRLVQVYSKFDNQELKDCILKISKKIGGQNLNEALKLLDSGDYYKFAGIALKYYDKTYSYGLSKRELNTMINISVKSGDPSNITELIENNI